MKNIMYFFTMIIGIILVMILTIILVDKLKNFDYNSGKPISYPEEIQIAKPGDTLIVYSVKDSIYIGFKNK